MIENNIMINQKIMNENYTDQNLSIDSYRGYDQRVAEIRQNLLKKYAYSKDVLDLCCGTGEYVLPILAHVKQAWAIDFSENMLSHLRRRSSQIQASNLTIKMEDARNTSLESSSIECVFCFTALYIIPDVDKVISEISRILKKDGIAILEFGNSSSLTRIISEAHHNRSGWAKPYPITTKRMLEILKSNNLEIIERRYLNFLPLLHAPKGLKWLTPICHPLWKKILGIKVSSKILDEWISGLPLIRSIAFKHILVVKATKS